MINFLNSIFGAPFWTGIAAIATTGVVILTYLSLKRIRKERKAQLNRESIGKVYRVLLLDLKTILERYKIETLESIYPANWKWEEIREGDPYIAYQVPEKLHKNLNKFSDEAKNYEILRVSFKEKFENLLTEIVKNKEILPEKNFKKIEDIHYFEIKPIDKHVNIYQLFFHHKNLKEFLNQDKLNGEFKIDFFDEQSKERESLSEEKFNKIFKIIENREYLFNTNRLPQKDFQKLKTLYQNVESLKDKIEKIIKKLSKEKI